MDSERIAIMAHITKSNYRVWHQKENIITNILNELECSETKHFRYWFRGTHYNQYKIRADGIGGKAIGLSPLSHGLDTLEEIKGHYLVDDTVEQKRIKSLKYILAKAYYQMCCELLQINCMKKDQHNKALEFAVGTGVDIYQHLLKCKDIRVNKKFRRKRKSKFVMLSRFDILDL